MSNSTFHIRRQKAIKRRARRHKARARAERVKLRRQLRTARREKLAQTRARRWAARRARLAACAAWCRRQWQGPVCGVALPAVATRINIYGRLTRLNRPIGAFLLMWPTLWAIWLASHGHPSPQVLVVFVAGVFVMRSAGCVMNDFADRKIDGHVWRTDQRPFATGEIKTPEAMLVFVLLVIIAVGLVLTMNRLTQYLAIGGLFLAITYPFMKRYTYLPQPYLGMAFGWAIPMAYAAQTGELTRITWLLFIANIFWATAYDTAYAMADREDDLKIGVKSSAILFGHNDRLIIGLLHALVLGILVLVGHQMALGAAYYYGLGVAAVFALYQQGLIRKRDPKACFQAFMNNNWFGAAIFVGLCLSYIFAAQ